MSINGSRKIKPKERARLKSTPKRGILGQEDTIIIDLGGFFKSIIRSRHIMVSSVFKEPVYQILGKIKNESYFK